jgi:hypothetical protein
MSLSSATKVAAALAVASVLALTGSVAFAAGAATVIATLAEHWSGKTWSVSPTVNPSSGTFSGDAR